MTSERPFQWGTEALWQQLEPLLPGLSVEVIAHVDSTNAHLLQRYRGSHSGPAYERGVPGRRAADHQPCLLVAEHQSGGRGRMGRGWLSSRGASLTFSLALVLVAADWSGLSLAIGVGLADALDPPGSDDAGPRIGLKWPNDLLLDDRKLGGILIETLAVGAQRVAVIGIGLNVRPIQTAGPLSSGFACLTEIDPHADLPDTLHRIGPALVQTLHRFEREGFAPFHERFERRDALQGRAVRSGSIEGMAQGVTPTGGLLVQTDNGPQVITSNEVSVRLTSWAPTTQSGLPC
jgi:BirA family biotin operon repressor/biotin-[acetyl-CoA-carboxylase] ligase